MTQVCPGVSAHSLHFLKPFSETTNLEIVPYSVYHFAGQRVSIYAWNGTKHSL